MVSMRDKWPKEYCQLNDSGISLPAAFVRLFVRSVMSRYRKAITVRTGIAIHLSARERAIILIRESN